MEKYHSRELFIFAFNAKLHIIYLQFETETQEHSDIIYVGKFYRKAQIPIVKFVTASHIFIRLRTNLEKGKEESREKRK